MKYVRGRENLTQEQLQYISGKSDSYRFHTFREGLRFLNPYPPYSAKRSKVLDQAFKQEAFFTDLVWRFPMFTLLLVALFFLLSQISVYYKWGSQVDKLWLVMLFIGVIMFISIFNSYYSKNFRRIMWNYYDFASFEQFKVEEDKFSDIGKANKNLANTLIVTLLIVPLIALILMQFISNVDIINIILSGIIVVVIAFSIIAVVKTILKRNN